jgi:hypothetical protein
MNTNCNIVMVWCGVVWYTSLGPLPNGVAYACTNIQQVASATATATEEEEEEEGDTPHVDTWCNASVELFGGLR